MQHPVDPPDPCVYWLDGRASPVHSVGGKGASLSTLRSLGAPVPAAAAIPTWVYRDFAKTHHLPTHLSLTCHGSISEIRANILNAPFTSSQQAAMNTLEHAFCTRSPAPDAKYPPFAVRSSAPAEDSSLHAFAGLHDTILGVCSSEGLERAVRQCWASLWSERAVAYRHQHDLLHLPMDMAVVVQHLVPCDVSFVAFALDPVSGDDECVVISATWGLGEAIVTGIVIPDEIRVDRTNAIHRYTIGTKHQMVIATDPHGQSGVRTVPTPRLLQQQQSITDDQAIQIATLVRTLSAGIGVPADVEGGFASGQLHCFQARPITTGIIGSSSQ